MRTELPGERLQRRLGLKTDPGDDASDDPEATGPGPDDSDPNALLPRWLPDSPARAGWLGTVRADPGRAGALGLAVLAVVAVLITVFTLVRDRPAPVAAANLPAVQMVSSASSGPDPQTTAVVAAEQPVVVSVIGLVHKPGVATLTSGARVADALTAAGGALDGADTAGLNMARPLADGEQIVVGIAAQPGQPGALGSSVGGGAPGGVEPASGPPPGTPKPGSGAPVNLNTATAEQLDALPGVGPVTAAAIVAWRDAHGKFASVDQLAEVDGIGPARLEKLRPLVRV